MVAFYAASNETRKKKKKLKTTKREKLFKSKKQNQESMLNSPQEDKQDECNLTTEQETRDYDTVKKFTRRRKLIVQQREIDNIM